MSALEILVLVLGCYYCTVGRGFAQHVWSPGFGPTNWAWMCMPVILILKRWSEEVQGYPWLYETPLFKQKQKSKKQKPLPWGAQPNACGCAWLCSACLLLLVLVFKPLLRYLTQLCSVIYQSVLPFGLAPAHSLEITLVLFLCFSRLHLNKKATDKQPYSKLPGVSLLKPLKGVDPNLINNLETFFELDYPKVSIVLSLWEMGYIVGLLIYLGNFNTVWGRSLVVL
jgi:hypothetical protein